jgi:uncharacterized protein YegJ (DUF2314 family)
MRRTLILIALLALCLACNKKQAADKVTYVAADDPKMNAAIDKARATINTFIVVLKNPKAGQTQFSVKMPVTDGKQTEHMWLFPVSYDGKKFHGTINNDPELVKNVKLGQKVSIETSQISDWMYVENGKLVGGYTLRVLREAMPPSERAEFDRSVPFTVD